MGAPAYQSFIPIQNGLDFNAPKKRVTATVAPQSEVDINEILGLSDSDYEGMKTVGDTGYYLKNNTLYEPYTITTSYPNYGMSGFWGYQPTSNRAEGTIEVGDQAFKPVTGDKSIPGFIPTDDGYEISQAYINANKPKYQGAPQQDLMPLLSLSTMPQQDLMPLLSLATIPQQQTDQSTSYGAGRFLTQNSLDMLSRADDTPDFSNATANAALAAAGGK